ncbi:tyrosine-type recombinase/integrase [Tsukamurella soli]|uniref:Site-specific integrase n=1 Tax=Tsukamurella soli TaxID=644556 RepID=A0ABP8J7J4_9ACTN
MAHQQRRNRRAGVEDRWTKTVRDAQGNETRVPSARHGTGMRWLARYVDDDGAERTKSFARKTDAQVWIDGQTAALVTGTHVDPARAGITFAEFFREWSATQVWTASTRIGMEQAMAKVPFTAVPMSRLEERQIQAWVKAMADNGMQPSTIRQRVRQVRTVIRAAMRGRRRVLAYDPCESLKLPIVVNHMQIPAPAEVKYLLDEAPEDFRAAVALAAFAGTRDGEVRALKGTDVRFLQREVNIEWQYRRGEHGHELAPPKYGSIRVVPVTKRLTDIVAQHLAEQPGDDPGRWLFPGRKGMPASATYLTRRWSETRQGLDRRVRFHDLRHFYASGLIAAGCDVKTVQHALGHKSATMTLDTYGHLWPDGDDRARRAGDALAAQVLDVRAAAAAD